MIDEGRIAKAAEKMAKSVLQDAGYKISDLLQSYPQELRVFVLVAMQGAVNSVLPLLDDLDRHLFAKLMSHTTVVVAPTELDPGSLLTGYGEDPMEVRVSDLRDALADFLQETEAGDGND